MMKLNAILLSACLALAPLSSLTASAADDVTVVSDTDVDTAQGDVIECVDVSMFFLQNWFYPDSEASSFDIYARDDRLKNADCHWESWNGKEWVPYKDGPFIDAEYTFVGTLTVDKENYPDAKLSQNTEVYVNETLVRPADDTEFSVSEDGYSLSFRSKPFVYKDDIVKPKPNSWDLFDMRMMCGEVSWDFYDIYTEKTWTEYKKEIVDEEGNVLVSYKDTDNYCNIYEKILELNDENDSLGGKRFDLNVTAFDKTTDECVSSVKTFDYVFPTKKQRLRFTDKISSVVYFVIGDESVNFRADAEPKGDERYTCFSDFVSVGGVTTWVDCSTDGYYTYSGLNDGGLNAQDDGREILCCVYSNDENQDYLRTTVVLKAVEKGDVNCDKEIGIADCVALNSWLLGNKSGITLASAADLNNDKKINVYDEVLLRQAIAGQKDA
ncbi:MAG: dockerin type I repeat-containing protein [Ruminococcus sp.]|nr:dockerin type I repeat-containing protein [Ruminococcus sp.]